MRRTHTNHRSSPASRLRAAFTLIELLMVISIISLLIAMLVPAVSSALHRAKIAQVVSDVQGLSNAADSFKGQYGWYPPSSITLYETSAGWSSAAAAPHRSLIRRIWPDFDFTYSAEATPGQYDINGDGAYNTVTLNGQECLVFFLGGMPEKDAAGRFRLTGFSANRRNPMSRAGSSRTQFFKSFDASRLADANGNNMPEYHDIFNAPGDGPAYAYLSTTNASNQYNAADAGMTSHYTQGTNSPWKPDGFQIISAGADHTLGPGGEYTEATASALLVGARDAERDNITNFSGGALNE